VPEISWRVAALNVASKADHLLETIENGGIQYRERIAELKLALELFVECEDEALEWGDCPGYPKFIP
jgi:hypothetical protein